MQLKTEKLTGPLRELGIKHRFTPTYTPQCNLVERANRTIKTMVAQYVRRRHRSWAKHLTELQFAINIAVHEATSYSPTYLNCGREFRRSHGPPISPTDMRRRLGEAYELGRINLARAFQRQEQYYNLRHRGWRPTVGETV